MHPRLEPLGGEARGIGRGLVDAGDAEGPRARAARVGGQHHDLADREAALPHEAARDEDIGGWVAGARGGAGRPRGWDMGEDMEESAQAGDKDEEDCNRDSLKRTAGTT